MLSYLDRHPRAQRSELVCQLEGQLPANAKRLAFALVLATHSTALCFCSFTLDVTQTHRLMVEGGHLVGVSTSAYTP